MENVMKELQSGGELDSVGMRRDLFEDFEWTEAAVIEFLHRSLGLDVFCAKPDPRSDFKFWRRYSAVASCA